MIRLLPIWIPVVNDNFNTFQVVIRRLPPSFTEDQLKEVLGGLPEHDFFYFVGNDMRYLDLYLKCMGLEKGPNQWLIYSMNIGISFSI